VGAAAAAALSAAPGDGLRGELVGKADHQRVHARGDGLVLEIEAGIEVGGVHCSCFLSWK